MRVIHQSQRTPRARVLSATLLAIPMLAAFSGCWPFNRGPTPQQKFFDQLNRGDAVGANNTWLEMSPQDREKLSRGEGLVAPPSKKDLQAALERHKEGDAAPVTIGPDPGSVGGWQSLPQILHATPIPPQTPETPSR